MTKNLLILSTFILITGGICAQSANVGLNEYAGSSSTKYCYSSVGLCGFYYNIDSAYLDKFRSRTNCSSSSSKNPSYFLVSDTEKYVVGKNYTLALKLSGSGSTYNLAVWADFNHNYSFADTGEFIFMDTPSSTHVNVPLKIASTVKPGKTRLRVMFVNYPTKPLNALDACDSNKYIYGETVDIDINIVASTGIISISCLPDFELRSVPNPAHNASVIYYTLPKDIEQGQLIVYNLLGVEVKRVCVYRAMSSVNLSTVAMPSGNYIYHIQTHKGISESRTLVVAH